MIIGVLVTPAMFYSSLRTRLNRQKHGFEGGPMWMFILEHALISGLLLYFLLSSYKGIANVVVVMGILIAFFTLVTTRTTIGRQIYALGGNENAAKLSGVHTEKLTFITFITMGVLAALGGLIFVARLNTATPKAGLGFDLDVICRSLYR
jgi:putative multiple sugar transport system permease protein